jgi:hypothetical protein
MNKAKEKAEELVSVYFLLVQTIAQQKQCALIAVDEIIESVNDEHVSDIFIEFWEEVKTEIEKL